jgi:excinuclease ABC subunit C
MIDTLEEELSTYISKFYDKHNILPKEVMIPNIIDNEILSEAFGIKFYTPLKGQKKKILDLAYDNAKNYFNEQMTIILKDDERTEGAIEELEKLLHIDKISRVELFDNSNLFGTFNVSGMVVFIDGKPAKNEYRKFKITNQVNDDYGTMREVIYRRYFRVLKDKLEKPDLIIVDGGIGQVNVAREVLKELYLDIPVCGLKKNDKHNTSELVGLDPIQIIPIDKKSNLFLLLTKMQDEVHNYTISYHKQIRSKGALDSVLDNISGIGEVRKKKLMKRYRSVSKMKEATVSELKEILPEEVAINLLEYLNQLDSSK